MNSNLEIINPPNLLKSKVKDGGPGAIDADTLARAEVAVAGLTDQYLEWVAKDLDKITSAYTELSSPDGDLATKLDDVFQISHDIKGQGGSFGYDLMTVIGNQLCRLIENSKPENSKLVEGIGVHINSMKLVIAQNIKGDGGKVGDKILSGLDLVYKKTTA